ncbi:hypothetical protein KKA00_12375, partial [bacterium]|nr:hypothetical protein [bacterium]
MNSYLIGIDGGASRSTAILVDASSELVSTEHGPGLNPLSLDGVEFNSRIASLIQKLLADYQVGDVKGLCAGLAGTGNETVRLKTSAAIKQAAGIENVHVISDALAALWGAFQGKPGLLLIAGTGSICLGLDEQGETARAGGFGRVVGDEGSGYWISVSAIRKALWEVDGRGSSSTLPDM